MNLDLSFYNWELVRTFIIKGFYFSLLLTVVATIGGVLFGTLLAMMRLSGRKLLELGRSCVQADHRGGAAMLILWNGLAEYVLDRGIEVLFGAASFHGTDEAALAQPLAYLHHHHLAPPAMRVRARPAHRREMALIAPDQLDRTAAMAATPALIKAYLRLGGFVGDGAWIDAEFNTTDVCLVMDTGQMSARHRDFYIRKQGQS